MDLNTALALAQKESSGPKASDLLTIVKVLEEIARGRRVSSEVDALLLIRTTLETERFYHSEHGRIIRKKITPTSSLQSAENGRKCLPLANRKAVSTSPSSHDTSVE